MALLTQLNKYPRKARFKRTKVRALWNCPQKKGICYFFEIMAPRKPNSAKRKVVRIRLSTKKRVFGYIPGTGGHTLQKYSHVLLQGNIIQDLPNVHYSILRGILDLKGLFNIRWQARSKYGTRDLTRVPRRVKRDLLSKYRKNLLLKGLLQSRREKQLVYLKTFFLRSLLVNGRSYCMWGKFKGPSFFSVIKAFSVKFNFSFFAKKFRISLNSIDLFRKWLDFPQFSIFLSAMTLFLPPISVKSVFFQRRCKVHLIYFRNLLYFYFQRRLFFSFYLIWYKYLFFCKKNYFQTFYLPSLFFYRKRYQNFLLKTFLEKSLQVGITKLSPQLRLLLSMYSYSRGYLNFRCRASLQNKFFLLKLPMGVVQPKFKFKYKR